MFSALFSLIERSYDSFTFIGCLFSVNCFFSSGVLIVTHQPLADPFPPAGEDGDGSCVIWDDSFEGYNKWAATVIPIEGSAGCVLDGLPMECRFISGESSVQCPNNDCGTHAMTVTGRTRDGRVVASSTFLRLPGQPGWDGSLDGNYRGALELWNFNSPIHGAAFVDFVAQIGNRPNDFVKRVSWAGGSPQNAGISAEVTKLVRDTLSSPDCIGFYTSVLNAVSTKSNPVLDGGNLAKIFEDFLNQPKRHTLISGVMPAGSDGFGNPIGNIKNSTAAIFSSSRDTVGVSMSIIAELFHLAGSNKLYTDQDLADVVHKSQYAADAATYIEPSITSLTQATDLYPTGLVGMIWLIAVTSTRFRKIIATLLQTTCRIEFSAADCHNIEFSGPHLNDTPDLRRARMKDHEQSNRMPDDATNRASARDGMPSQGVARHRAF